MSRGLRRVWSRAAIAQGVQRYSGITSLRWNGLPDGLYVFTFHRIGEASETPFDPNVFSCTPEAFTRHIKLLQSHFTIIRPAQLSELVEEKPAGRYALLTFDDGYRDNLEYAVPVLRKQSLEAVLFVATDMVEQGTLPWWDAVAFMVRHASVREVTFGDTKVALNDQNTTQTIREMLRVFKANPDNVESKLDNLRAVLRPTREPPPTQLIMDWDALSLAQRQGMTIGSHTASHPLLAHLDEAAQREELVRSRILLEERLGVPALMLAYPVGGRTSFSALTTRLAREAGYEFAFTTLPERNDFRVLDTLRIGRIGVSTPREAELRHQISNLPGRS